MNIEKKDESSVVRRDRWMICNHEIMPALESSSLCQRIQALLVTISLILTLDQVVYSMAKEIFDLSFENIAFGSVLFQIDGFISPALQNVCMLVFRRLLLTMFFLSYFRYYRLNHIQYSLFMKYISLHLNKVENENAKVQEVQLKVKPRKHRVCFHTLTSEKLNVSN